MSAAARIVIYHTSDIHAKCDFGERLAAMVEPGAMLVDCGDALAGSSVFYQSREEVADDLARAPYDAMAVGNREFHYLHPLFRERARILPPLVCSNLIDLRKREPVFQRELVVSRGGAAVRFLALLVPQYRTGSGWERIFGWRFLAPDVALAQMLDARPSAPSVAAAGPLPTVVLSHLGLSADRELAARFGGLAAILGGHTHEALWQPEMVGGVPIAHPGAHGLHVGRIELSYDGSATRLVSYRLMPLLRTESEEARERLRGGAGP
jgi:5'-nucleotidase